MAKLLSGTRIYGTATVDTTLFVNGTDDASSATTGAVQVVGGVGIGGTLYVQGTTVFAGDLAVNGGDITTTAATFNLIDTNATTVNFAGAATTIDIGNSSGNTNVRNSFNVDINSRLGIDTDSLNTLNGKLTVNLKDNIADIFTIREGVNNYIKINTDNSLELITFGVLPKYQFLNETDATGTGVASTTFAGGVGIAKKLFVGSNLDVLNNTSLGMNTTNFHSITGTVNVSLPDNTGSTFTIRESGNGYFTIDTANGSERITLGPLPRLFILNETDSTDKDTGAVVINGGVGIEKNLNVGGNTTINLDLAVNGGDITTTAATFNLIDTNATTVNFAGAATTIDIGAATGTMLINNGQVIFTTTDSIQIPVGNTSQRDSTPTAGQIRYNSELSTFEGYGPGNAWGSLGGVKDVDGNTYIIPETVPGANENILYFYNNGTLTLTLAEDEFSLKSGVDVVINSNTASTTKTTGALVVIGGVGVSGTVNANELTLTTDLEVQYGGTGVGTFTVNGILFGNSTDPLLVTAASNPGSNATTSYGILSTDINNVPVWTDVIDGGSY